MQENHPLRDTQLYQWIIIIDAFSIMLLLELVKVNLNVFCILLSSLIYNNISYLIGSSCIQPLSFPSEL